MKVCEKFPAHDVYFFTFKTQARPFTLGGMTTINHVTNQPVSSADAAAAGASISVTDTITEYLERADWRVNANANQDYSLGGMMLNTSGKVVANYWLNEVFSPEAGQAHRHGDIHIHDLDMLAGYCAGWSLRQLLEQGFGGVPGESLF